MNSGFWGIPTIKEIIEQRSEMQESRKIENFTILVESTISSQGLVL